MSNPSVLTGGNASRIGERATPAGRTLGLSHRAVIVAALAVTFVAYVGTLGYEFVYDDQSQIVQNPNITSWKFAPLYFTQHVWSHLQVKMVGNYYRPVFLLWLLVNNTLFGLNAAWWHLATVVVHVAATFMVYLLARRLSKDAVAATVATLIFGLHPVHIEGVAWVSGVTEPLLALFLIPSFLFYMNWREARPKSRFYFVASVALYSLAVLAKETALVLPVIILIYEWMRRSAAPVADSRIRRAFLILTGATPYFAVTIAYLVARAAVLRGLGHAQSSLSLSTLVMTWPSVLWFYLKQLFWPANLSVFYDVPYVTSPGLANFVLPAVGLAAFAVGFWLLCRRLEDGARQSAALALAWLVLPILPVLNLAVFAEGETVHDRYLYLPSIGFAIIAAIALRRLKLGGARLFGQPAIQSASALIIVLALGVSTSSQHIYWASNLVLYHHGVTLAPDSRIAKTGLANELSERGYFDEASKLYKEVVERHPTYWTAVKSMGCNFMRLGNYEDAAAYLSRGIELRPIEPTQYLSISVALQELKRMPEAERAIRQAITLLPNGYGFHYQLGDVLKAQGKLEAALDEFKLELANNPDFSQAREQMADLEARLTSRASSLPKSAPGQKEAAH
ncbi:MAG TPA: tetratricopeptide repeat protein [Blastocatellia bacterium]|nr:tetratricopeptide repeat protein [Blastocatellia bacterium]